MNLRDQRLHEAHRAGLRGRLTGQFRLPEARADELLAAWDAEAASRGLVARANSGYWREAPDWITAQLRPNERQA